VLGGADNWTARLGLRLEGSVETGAGLFQPHLKANVWQMLQPLCD
jgi:hypothetical protein